MIDPRRYALTDIADSCPSRICFYSDIFNNSHIVTCRSGMHIYQNCLKIA
ncbi:hypothetical protein RchiOBHm_Chr1g0352171 [Rosa chinensis]|uniref:Uncharacterized protein n=1 Tax=Rosa chinensis TaxID=74649 RepID=A0A2P6SGI3_ROSCH|nr:hypothetical protein RchiOBHm_Chr1g0352171 [Rosa chinensis]